MLIPPLAQLVLCFAIAGGLAAFLPIWEFHAPNWLIVLEAVLGVLFLMPAVVSFVRHKTTVNPQTPSDATTLVTGGIYGISRNPMYVGMLLLLLAFVLWLGNVSAALAALLFFISIDRFQIEREEESLRQAFGDTYNKYALRVPRWLVIKNR